MVKPRALSSPTSAGVSSTPPQHMYFLEGGLLVVTNLLKTAAWVRDTERSHCNVCVQQFMPFRRRHHCRTCGEVVCGSCSAQRKIHLTEVNVECATRVCSFCMIRATDAAIDATANDAALRASVALYHSSGNNNNNQHHHHQAVVANSTTAAKISASLPPSHPRGRHHNQPHQHSPSAAATTKRAHHQPTPPPVTANGRPHVSKKMSMLSLESELTDGSVVQLWPPPVAAADETARLEIARRASIRATERDPTMALLVSIVARTLACPVAFIGILDDHHLWFKATVGWNKTHIPRDDCVCAVQQKTMVVADTNLDKHFHANQLMLGDDDAAKPMRYYAGAPIVVLGQCIGAVSAIDSEPHWETSASMTSTLEAVANIVSEVLEQRIDGSQKAAPNAVMTTTSRDPLAAVAAAQRQLRPQPQHHVNHHVHKATVPSEEPKPQYQKQQQQLPNFSLASTASLSSPIKSSCDSDSTLADTCDHLRAVEYLSESSLDSDEDLDEFSDDESDNLSEDNNELEGRASETAPSSSSASASASSAVHPWPNSRGSIMVDRTSFGDDLLTGGVASDSTVGGMPRFSLAVPVASPEINEKIGKAMEFFQALQSSRWSACYHGNGRDDDILSFEMLSQGRHFTKSHARLAGDCTHVIARLQTYDDPRLYAELIDSVTERRQKLNVQTWVDHVQLRPGFEASCYAEVKVLSHWRQYPDGSNVIIAFNDSNTDLIMIEDFLFGWFIAPSGPDASGACCVNVSSIVAEPVAAVINENQSHHDQFNLSKRLLEGLHQSLPYHYDMTPMVSVSSDQSTPSSPSSSLSDNQRGVGLESSFASLIKVATVTPTSPSLSLGDSMAVMSGGTRSRTSSSNTGDKMLAIRSKYNEPSSLNDNERMMLDLLDKTISTQEVLAAQQHVMANVMDYHGTQLQRISSAIDRVENILHTNGDKLKQLHLVKPRSPTSDERRQPTRSPGRDRSGRQSIAL